MLSLSQRQLKLFLNTISGTQVSFTRQQKYLKMALIARAQELIGSE